MLESLILILLVLTAGIFLVISIIVLLFGIFKKSEKLKKVGFGIASIPVLCIGTILFWYLIAIPSFNQREMEEYSGTYTIQNSELEKTNTELKLFEDGTYTFHGNEEVDLAKSGTWETGWIDGQFLFNDEEGNIISFASPFGGDEIIFNLYVSNEVRFHKTKSE